MNMKRIAYLGILCALFTGCSSKHEPLSIIPMPQQVELSRGSFRLDQPLPLVIAATPSDSLLLHDLLLDSEIGQVLVCDRNLLRSLSDLQASLRHARSSQVLSTSTVIDSDDSLREALPLSLTLVDTLPGITSPEGYRLGVTREGITIASTTGAGLFYGVHTLLQLRASGPAIPLCTITDEPRLVYRGLMLDVSRHFFPVDVIKRQIDAMARYKMNHLHLHLTDAAGWRLEIKRYPELTRRAAWRTHATWKEWWNADRRYVEEGSAHAHGGYYTQEEMRDLVAYAQARHITIIPEIEMPSHSEEVLAVYPELSCAREPYKNSDFCIGSEATFEFLENVLAEVIDLFPSEYIHIGGDEASKQAWPSCPHCQARMQREGLTHVDELQSYLIHRVERFLNAHGRQLLGWDEILDGGLAPHATVMSWRGTEGGLRAIHSGHRAIMTPGEYCYFDAYQDAPHTQPEAFGGYLPLKKVYHYDPVPDTLSGPRRSLLYGVQANLFAEYVPTAEHLEYMLYPRLLAIAEVGWSSPAQKDYEDFHRRALAATEQLRREGYHTFDLEHEVGNRPGSEQPVDHLALSKPVSYTGGSAYYPGYSAGGDSALVDGLHGGWTYGDHRWQGFLGRAGVDVTIDLGEARTVRSVKADFMQICGPGVFMPSAITITVSADGETFRELYHADNEVVRDDAVTFKTFGWEGRARDVRYIRYQAQRSHHGGFLFVDEIVVD